MKFRPPNEEEARQAIGSLDGLPERFRKAFLPSRDFEPVPAPGPNDWLAVHPEPGQTFADFVRSRPNRPDAIRNTVYLQPLEDFETGKAPPLQTLAQFAQAFFSAPVQTLSLSTVSGRKITTRTNPYTRQPQLLTRDVLRHLQQILPKNAFCIVGITMRDLYPAPSWNFVFGEAHWMIASECLALPDMIRNFTVSKRPIGMRSYCVEAARFWRTKLPTCLESSTAFSLTA